MYRPVKLGVLVKKVVVLILLGCSALAAPVVFADKAVLAGGCFWCMEKDFETLEGVTDVISGFTGGTAKNPTYRGNHAGHYLVDEALRDFHLQLHSQSISPRASHRG